MCNNLMENQNLESREIYLYDDIDKFTALDTCKIINEINYYDDCLEESLMQEMDGTLGKFRVNFGKDTEIMLPERPPIILHINSVGGSFDDGIAIYNTIRNSGTPVIGIVEGACYSMAVPILLACDGRYGYKNTKIMLHDVSSGAFGKGRDMERQIQAITDTRKDYMDIILEETLIDEEKLEDIVDRGIDWYINAREAYDFGIYEEILDAPVEDEDYVAKCDICGEELCECECGEDE